MTMLPYQNRLLRAVHTHSSTYGRLHLRLRSFVTATPPLADSEAAQSLLNDPTVAKANFRKRREQEEKRSLLGGGQF
jgi:hypothetical protein